MDENRDPFAKDGWLGFIVFLTVPFCLVFVTTFAIIAELSSKKSKERPTWMGVKNLVGRKM